MFTLSPIAEAIVTSILQRQLRPGERLGEKELAELFDVSRTLVREALKQLQTRGFVDVRPRIGWYVVEPSFEDARQIYAARRVIETGMLRDAGKPLQSVIRKLRQHVADERKAISTQDTATRTIMLADFHVCLAECLANRYLAGMMVDLSARTTLVSAMYQSTTEAQTSNDDHVAIVDALAEGDLAKAEQLMRTHIDSLASRLDEKRARTGTASDRLREALGPAAASLRQRQSAP